jgi:RimJ/RimL family protein N-acetyltransferase
LDWGDLDILQKWYEDPEVSHWASGSHPDTLFSRYALEEQFEREARSDSIGRFMVETQNEIPIGLISFKSTSWQIRSVVIGIFLGEKEYWGHGYGTEAVRIFLHHLFEQCNYRRVELETWTGNARAIRTYEKCGFQIEGRLRDGFYVDGQYQDRIVMGILRNDYEQIKNTW